MILIDAKHPGNKTRIEGDEAYGVVFHGEAEESMIKHDTNEMPFHCKQM